MCYIIFDKLNKKYKNSRMALKNFNLTIENGEFVVIVGPSGSGKSTLLELICGFESPTSGDIYIDNILINNILPKDRNVSMVFQNYALFPHMTVYDNIDFGMKIRKEDKYKRKEKVIEACERLKLIEYIKDYPKNLSGGQRQRVALARAMVREPKLFLMDEPLSNLDAQLRYSTSKEILKLHKDIKSTVIYVTHDQTEAMTMGDRIVVLNNGEIQQIGTPNEIYESPNNLFVAKFMGKPTINTYICCIKLKKIYINDNYVGELPYIIEDGEYILGIRSENIKENKSEDSLEAKIVNIEYIGGEKIIELISNDVIYNMKTFSDDNYSVGKIIDITLDTSKVNLFNINTKEKLEE